MQGHLCRFDRNGKVSRSSEKIKNSRSSGSRGMPPSTDLSSNVFSFLTLQLRGSGLVTYNVHYSSSLLKDY